MCCRVTKKNKKRKVCLMNSYCFNTLVMSVNGELHNTCHLYVTKNTVTIVPRGNFTKKQIIFNL